MTSQLTPFDASFSGALVTSCEGPLIGRFVASSEATAALLVFVKKKDVSGRCPTPCDCARNLPDRFI